ncbi:MAG: hypothetical protein LBE16_07720 [Clostridiales Family XIII bacterium]|jgi:hypothetical protein|nr:hypothetical protein [Clostridiales Family XIII bacterium]
MKDEHSVLFRTAFVLALAGAIFAYAYFLYPSLRAQLASDYHERLSLEKEKTAIAEIMLDPGLISERITDMQGQLLKTRPIKGLTPAGVIDDITRIIDSLGLELQSVILGVPEVPGGAVSDEPQLLSMPVTIHMTASYDGGMYFIDSLEQSETGTYKIGGFSFKPAAITGGTETSADGANASDDASGADAGEAGEAESAPEASALLEWDITIYLLYYG